MREIRVPLPGREQSYQILLDTGLRQQVGDRLAQILPGRRLWVVTDTLVGRLYGQEMLDRLNRQGFHAGLLTVPRGERSKSWPVAARLTQQLLDQGADRGSALVALGGGVVGDLAGFVAAIFMRGIPVVQVPTTLLAMVDAAIGGKTAINIPAGKNLLGAFHQPRLVLIDPEFLLSLPRPGAPQRLGRSGQGRLYPGCRSIRAVGRTWPTAFSGPAVAGPGPAHGNHRPGGGHQSPDCGCG